MLEELLHGGLLRGAFQRCAAMLRLVDWLEAARKSVVQLIEGGDGWIRDRVVKALLLT